MGLSGDTSESKLMRFVKFLAFFLFILSTLFLLSTRGAKADDVNQQLSDKAAEITQLEQQLSQIHAQENTLNTQLSYIDTQARLTQARIDQTNFQIQKLDSEISDLDGRITRLSGTVDSLSAVLLQRIVNTYKYSNITPIDLIFSSSGFSDILERLKYIQVAQEHDKKVLYDLQATKSSYNDQKTDKQTRQQEEEKLKGDLDNYQKQLDADRTAKAALLRVTQNNESVYQARLQAALAEQQAILSILGGGGNEVADGSVHKGDTIGNAIAGPSACSSGTHLHFEVHQNGQIINPASVLSNKNVSWDNSPDGSFSFSGSWDWPMSDTIYIAQGYGMTWWAQHGWYGGGPHTGIDMYSSSGLAVHSVHDGQLSHGGIACGGGTLYYKKVDHGDGYISYYLHVV